MNVDDQCLNKREYGIDLLKIISMFMVVTLHVLGVVIPNCTLYSIKYQIAGFLEIFCYCAVDCFALASGYIMCNIKFKYSRIIYLWFEVVFYSILITLLFTIFAPFPIGKVVWIKACLPVVFRRYWYFTAYFGMFFIIPFINFVVNKLSYIQVKILIITIIFLFSIFPTLVHKDLFSTNNGYSMLWLCLIYILGCFISKYKVFAKIKRYNFIVVYFLSIFITYLSKYLIENTKIDILKEHLENYYLITYTSPFILICAISLLLFCVNKSYKNKIAINIIKFLSPLSFSVYIIHFNELIFNYILTPIIKYICSYDTFKFIFAIITFTIIIYFISSFIDFIRLKLFKLLNIKKISEIICTKFSKISSNLLKRFN